MTTKTAPADQRGGTYERDSTTRALLAYGTHTIHDLRRDQKATTFGSDDDRDIQIVSEHVSKQHGRIVSRARGTMLLDDGSKNGTHIETRRSLGVNLRPSIDDTPVGANGALLRPGTTFVVGHRKHRYIAIDGEIRRHHPALLDLLGTEDEVRDTPERVSPSDFLLAADSAGHLLITGHPSCEPQELARIAHKISKRRRREAVERDHLPADREAQGALLRDDANKTTLILNLLEVGDSPTPLDARLVMSLFSPSYQVRMIVLTRTVEDASVLLGEVYLQPMMRVALRPLAERRAAIEPMLDRWLAARGSPLRIADLTPENRRRILGHGWRALDKLRETAERLDAIIRAPSLNQAREALGVARSTFYGWFGRTLRLDDPLVSEDRERALRAALAAQPRQAKVDRDESDRDESDRDAAERDENHQDE